MGDMLDAIVTERRVAEFMANQEGFVEVRAGVFVPDRPVPGIELRAATGEQRTAGLDRFDVEPDRRSRGADDRLGRPGIRTIGRRARMEGGSPMSGEFDGVQWSGPIFQQPLPLFLGHLALNEKLLERYLAVRHAGRFVGLVAQSGGKPV